MPVESPDAHVLQTCWVWFRLESSHRSVARERCLCRREKEFLTISTESGAVHYVALPFMVEKMAPLSEGLLLERSTREETGSGLPTMFSLLSSTGDLSPIVTRQSFTHATSATTCSYVTDPRLHIVDSCPQDRDLVLLYHTSSQTHSIWRIRPTSAEDIPAHVASTPHPGRRSTNSSTAVTPRSTSAPSQYDLHPTTPSHRRDTPVQMILTGNKKLMRGLNKATPHMLSGGGGGRGGNRLGSGRSPFAPRLPTPLNLGNQKRSKSVSPMHQAGRLSPFSQTVHSNSWTTFFSEESAIALEPLLPQICIHKLAECVERIQAPALDFFACGCLFPTGLTYYYFTTSTAELWVSAECAEARTPALKLPEASHAVPITDLNVVLVLSPRGELYVYSGVLKVCELGLDWLFANGDTDSGKVDLDQIEGEGKLVSLRGGEGAQFSVELSSGLVLTSGLPPIYPHTLQALGLKATAEVIPKDTAHLMLADYYSNCIQLSPSPFSIHHFLHWLLSLLQLPSLPPLESSQPFLLPQCITHLQRNLTVLRLFEKKIEYTPSPLPMPLPSSKICLVQYARNVFKVLHLVYEELKVYSESEHLLPLMARFLHHVATCLGFPSYCDLYHADHPSLIPSSLGHTSEGGDEEEKMECEDDEVEGGGEDTHPPNLMSHLHLMLTGAAGHVPFPLLSDVCKKTAQLVQLYALYSGGAGALFSLSSLFTIWSTLPESALTEWQQLLEKTSSSHQRVVLWMVAQGLTREDLASLPVGVALPLWDSIFHCREHPPPSDDLRLYELIGREDIVKTLCTAAGDTTSLTIETMEKDDGMKVDDEVIKLTFSKDLRVNEVKRLLNSSQPVKISLEQKPEVSDHEFIEQQELTLLTVCQRTMALPVGRGMFSLAMSKPLPTSPLSIPGVELTGRAPPKNSTVSLEHIEKPPNMVLWPQFHNGVAAGLRLSPNAKLDSTWILSNRPPPPLSTPAPEDGSSPAHSRCSPQHAGLLLALGLSGHLSSLMDFELFDYLQDKHELTTVAVLLGITASRVGSMQRSIASILSIFLPPLLPFGSADMEISQTIQTAALTAMGLLYLGSGNRHLSEVMLREIAHVPGPELEFADDRESYSLAAGIALGMITLGRGGDLPGMGDLRLVERLAVLILGGPKSQEPEVVNTHVTSPAATVALGLMYLKTNESSVASRLDAPSTLYELDHIRPDFFILRMASRGLIMWSDVQPTQEWINNHIPEIVQRHAFQSSDRMEGQCDPNIDYQTLSQAMVCISAGCCLAIGLRYAGTLDKQAHSVLMKNIRFLLTKMTTPASAEEVGKSCLEMCINVAVLSVAMVMSGSGDLEVLRIIRRLHARVTPPEVTYGSHMASHMALGFLFLGGCRYSLSRSDKAIACLYSAVFPLFPSSTTDTRYHLQALRHLYVLAAEPRVLVTRDVETGQATSVEVCVRGEREIRGRTPCIVPEWNSINEIEICSCDFWPIKLSLSGEENRQVLAKSGTAFVRRKTGEKGGGGGGEGEFASGALLPQHFYTTCCVKGKLELFGEDGEEDNPLLRCLYSPLLAPQDSQDTNWQRFMTAALLECVSEEKLSVFPSLLHLEKVSHKVLSSSSSSTTELWQLKLGCALAEMTGSRQDHCPQSFHSDLATLLMMRVKQSLYKFGEEMGEEREEEVLRAYFMCGRGGGGEVVLREKEAEWLAATIVVYGIPPRHSLGLTTETTYPELLTKMQALNAPPSAVVRLLPMMKSKLPEPLSLLFP